MPFTWNPYVRGEGLLARDPLRLTRNRLLARVAAPVAEPVTLAEAKLYLRIDDSYEDTLISDLIVAARMVAEGWLKRSLITQSWKLAYDYGIPACVRLPMGPVASITSVAAVARDGTTAALDSSTYWLSAAQDALRLDSMLISFRVEITYVAGYGDASAVPRPIKQGMLAHIATLYDSRGEGGTADLPEQVVALYMPFREVAL